MSQTFPQDRIFMPLRPFSAIAEKYNTNSTSNPVHIYLTDRQLNVNVILNNIIDLTVSIHWLPHTFNNRQQ